MADSLVDRLHEHSRRLGYAEQTHDADVLSMCKEAKPHIDEAANVIEKLGEALEYAHELRLKAGTTTHRDGTVCWLVPDEAVKRLTAALSLLRGDTK